MRARGKVKSSLYGLLAKSDKEPGSSKDDPGFLFRVAGDPWGIQSLQEKNVGQMWGKLTYQRKRG
jgi:hypothetical protein